MSGNKGAKKGEFHHAADHALWAIGGNVSAPLCGPNSTDSAKYNRYSIINGGMSDIVVKGTQNVLGGATTEVPSRLSKPYQLQVGSGFKCPPKEKL